MYNREVECMSQYPYEVAKMSRVRGGIWCQCEEGDFFLKEYGGGEQRIILLRNVLLELEKRGFAVDTPVLTSEEMPVGEDSYGKRYTLRKWFVYREIGAGCPADAREGATLLGKMLSALLEITAGMPEEQEQRISYGEMVNRQNKELKNISNFIGRKRKKNEFDMTFRSVFLRYYEQGLKVASLEEKWHTSEAVRQGFCHRDYTHHNVLKHGDEMAIVHFDNLGRDVCVADFALYLRKLLEKNEYSVELFQSLLEAFENTYPLTEAELRQLYLRMVYPSRFLKIANHYATTRKNHITLRDTEKLTRLLEQEEERSRFLAFLEEFVV